MKKVKVSKYLIFISFFTLLTVFISVLQKSYSNLTSADKKKDITDTSKNINPQLDLSVVDEIKNRQYINSSDLPESETATSNILLSDTSPAIVLPPPATSTPTIQPSVVTPTPTLIP